MTATVTDVLDLVTAIEPGRTSFNAAETKRVQKYLDMSRSDILTVTNGRWDNIVPNTDKNWSYCDNIQTMAAYRFYINPLLESQHQLVEMSTRSGIAQFIGSLTDNEVRRLQTLFDGNNGNIAIVNFGNGDVRLGQRLYNWTTGEAADVV